MMALMLDVQEPLEAKRLGALGALGAGRRRVKRLTRVQPARLLAGPGIDGNEDLGFEGVRLRQYHRAGAFPDSQLVWMETLHAIPTIDPAHGQGGIANSARSVKPWFGPESLPTMTTEIARPGCPVSIESWRQVSKCLGLGQVENLRPLARN